MMGFSEKLPEEERKKWIEWSMKKTYLKGETLIYRKYPAFAEHAHCEFCWAKFSQQPGDLKAGYYHIGTESWICDECYAIFKDYYCWKVYNSNEPE